MSVMRWIKAESFHGRKGAVKNNFTTQFSALEIDITPEALPEKSVLFRHNKFGLFSIYDRDFGEGGLLLDYVQKIAQKYDLRDCLDKGRVSLIAQPRFLGYIFNPVCFWIFRDAQDDVRAVMAEVSNTERQRHSYFCARYDGGPMTRTDRLRGSKVFYVSPFQDVAGHYDFRFDFKQENFGIWIDYNAGDQGLFTTMMGRYETVSSWRLLAHAVRFPLGALRVMALIHWQALRLWSKGVAFRPMTPSPKHTYSLTKEL